MVNLFDFLIQSGLALLLFYLLYFLMLRKGSSFAFNRFYLLAAVAFSLILPVLDFSWFFPESQLMVVSAIYLLPEAGVEMEAAPQSEFDVSWTSGILMAYMLGIFVFSLRLIGTVFQLMFFMVVRKKYYERNYILVPTDGKLPTFSFFRFTFLDNTLQLNQQELFQMLAHEQAHIHQKHSFDKLFLELAGIVFWFHPVIYFYKNSLSETHEYLADAKVIEDTERDAYCSLLVKQTYAQAGISLANFFNKSQTLKRIEMMKNYPKMNAMKLFSSVSLAAVIIFFFACQKEEKVSLMPDEVQTRKRANMMSAGEYQEEIQKDLKQLQEDNLLYTYQVIEIESKGKDNEKLLDAIDPSDIAIKYVFQDGIVVVVKNSKIIEVPIDETAEIIEESVDETADQIFSVVEDQPEPIGGFPAFYEYIKANLKYPEEARQKGISGKVYVQFVVSKTGKITDAQAVLGIGGGCDEEAVRVVSQSSDWTAGVQRGTPVSVRMVVPITFKL